MTRLVNEIAGLDETFILVLDDCHVLSEPAILELLTRLVEHQPDNLRLVLITRHDPPLSLARWRARQQMVDLRVADLHFTHEEIAQFFRGTLGASAAAEVVGVLEEATEGWIAGLRLAALSLRLTDVAEFLDAFRAKVTASVRDYLLDEVLKRQPDTLQDFLLKSSILDRLCAPLCQAILVGVTADGERAKRGAHDSSSLLQPSSLELLQQVERSNLFLIALDGQGEWYRFHPLFGEMLQHRLKQRSSAETIADLHRRAGAWLAERGFVDEAVPHALAAGDELAAARMVERNLHVALNREDRPLLERELALLPERLLQTRPILLLAQAFLRQWQFALAGIPPLLEQTEALLDATEADLETAEVEALRAQVAGLWSEICFFRGDIARTLAYSQQALERLPTDHFLVRGGVAIFRSLALHISGQGEAAEHFLTTLLDQSRGQVNAATIRVLHARCLTYRAAGELENLRHMGRRMLALATQYQLPVARSWAYVFVGYADYEANELVAAAENFTAGTQLAYVGHQRAMHECLAGLILTRIAQGAFDEAAAHLAQLIEFEPDFDAELQSLQARLALRKGDLESALRWSSSFTAGVSNSPMIWLDMPHLTRVKILLAEGTPASLEAALADLEALQRVAESQHNTWYLIDILAHTACVLYAQGRRPEALASLERAVTLARPGGYLRLFLDLGPTMAYLLKQLAAHGTAPDYVHRIVAAFPQPDAVSQRTRAAGVSSLLTARELEVLRLLSERLSDKEIADRLNVSTDTVKKHSAHIYDKLGVNNRRQAVARAQELRLLPG
jgi:LuxR family maltose regulon positive regulatory protein